jgi:hydrogenase-4 component H
VIVVSDQEQHRRVLEFFWRRCTYCGKCEEVCPEKAIRLSQQFETATNTPQDMYMRLEVLMGPCQRCGRCFSPPTPLDRMMKTGFRDGLERGRA